MILLSVGNRPEIIKYHNSILILNGTGEWVLQPVENVASDKS
jgi:hypothetical protein